MKGKRKILVVEDDTVAAMMMVSLLTRAGCDVLVAATGKEGMRLATTTRFDLITLDVNLPDLKGFDICRELKQRHFSRHTPVVFVSTCATIENQQRALDSGAADFIEKPFGVEFASRLLSHVEQTTVA